jgi:hypothetical protein
MLFFKTKLIKISHYSFLRNAKNSFEPFPFHSGYDKMHDYKFFLQENYFKQVFVSETFKEEPWEGFDFFYR